MVSSTLHAARKSARALVVAVVTLGVLTSAAWAAFGDYGIDVSSHQHPGLNWSKAKADGVSFAFIKATEGSTYTNPYFAGDWSATGDLGIYRGAYHFARPSVGTAALQAKYFVKVAGLQTGSGVLPPVLDLEDTGGLGVAALRTWTANWLQTVESLTGRTPMIYVSPSFWEGPLGNSTAFHHYPLWVAHYGVSSPRVPGGWPTWTFWQSTSSGTVNGISGRVDIDRFNGGPAQLARMANVTDGSIPGGIGGTTTPTGPTPTSVTLKAGRTSLYSGGSVTLYGRLSTATGGVADRTVGLWQQPQGSTTSTRIRTATTDSNGHYSFVLTPSATASYVVKWAGGAVYLASASLPVAVTVLRAAQTTLSMMASRDLVYPGQNVVFSGSLSAATGGLAGKSVGLWQQDEGATTSSRVLTTTTDSAGHYRFAVTPSGTASYFVKWGGGAMYSASASAATTVTYQPTVPTTVTLTADRSRAYAVQSVTLSGALTSMTGALAGQNVVIDQQDDGSTVPTRVATLTTGKGGVFSATLQPKATATYTVRYAGASVYAPAASTSVPVTLLQPKATSLDLKSWRTTLRNGQSMEIYGHLRTAAGTGVVNRHVRIYRRLVADSTWHRVQTVLTKAPNGYWMAVVSPGRSAVFKAVWVGGMRYLPATSNTLRVNVP